ncbi:MAG TPA: phosphate signaling complex protein PhoU [Sphingomicrobium sp.]|jgi:phosphate transport system protein
MMQQQAHTLKAFDQDLKELRELITDMGSFAEAAIEEAMRCLVEHDEAAAAELVQADVQLDELELEAERRIVQLIALRAPMADDLREAVAALKIAGVVERIGDYAKNIARRVRRLPKKGELEPMSLLPEMAKLASSMVRDVLRAFSERDPELARSVCARDDALDDFYESLFRTLLTYMMENPQTISASTTLLFVAKNLERIGDHATNIAEMVYYSATGERLAEDDGE